jgi:hypothetical protein
MGSLIPILYYLMSLFIVCASGMWLTRVLLPTKYSKYRIAFSFPLGMAWLILVSSWTSYMGFTFKESSFFIIGGSVILSIIVIVRDIINKQKSMWLPSRSELLVYGIAFISGIIVLFPMIFFNALRPYVDGFTYVSIADYLQSHGYFEKADPNPYYPWLTQMSLYQTHGFRMGTQFVLSLLSVVFNQKFSIYVFLPLLAGGQFLFVICIWLLTRWGLRLPLVASYIAVLFAAFYTSIPIINAHDGFLPQGMGLMFSVSIFAVIVKIGNWRSWKIILAFSILLSALIVTYSELLPFVGLSIIVVLLYKFVQNKSIRKKIFFNSIGMLVVSILISNISMLNAIKAILSQLKAVVGSHISYSVWEYTLYLLSIPVNYANNLGRYYPVIYFFLVVTVLFALYLILTKGLNNLRLKERIKIQLILIILFPYVALLVYFIFFDMDPWLTEKRGHSWSIYKDIQYMSIFVPVIIGISFYSLFDNGRFNKTLLIGISSLFIVFNLTMSFHNSKLNTQEMRSYTGENINPLHQYDLLYQQLRDVDKPINLIMPANLLKHKQLVAYFLRDHEIVSDWSNDEYIYPHMKPENRSPSLLSNGLFLNYNPNSVNKTSNMEIVKSELMVDFISGVYDLEQDDTKTWRWSSGDVLLSVRNISDSVKEAQISFDVTLPPDVHENQYLEVEYQEKQLYKLTVNKEIVNKFNIQLDLDPGENYIVLRYSGSAVKIGNDPRDLAYTIINFKYQIN